MKRKNKNILIVLAVIMIFSPLFTVLNSPNPANATTYSPYCTSPRCRAAADKEAAAQAKADELSSAANDLQGKIDSLNADIAAIEAELASYQAIADDLADQIKDAENKLESQQNALAELLVKMHFDNTPDAIMILAGSDSISDFAEKQARQETIKSQIISAAKEIKKLKSELDQKKASNDAIIANKDSKRSEIAAKRNEQSSLMANYKYNANAYAADAEAARKIKAQEINNAIVASINASGSGRNIASGADAQGNSYPYRNQCPGANLAFLAYGGYVCQCTSYAGWKAHEAYGVSISSWGNASNWGNSALAHGYRVDSNPAPGTVAYSTAGVYGHVMWVEAVNGSTITLSEYNYVYGDFSRRSGVPASAYRYIHFN